MADIMEKIIGLALGLGVLFLMTTNVILPFFNGSYNYTVTGLTASTLQGILLIILLVGLVGAVVTIYKRSK